ncbi:hypothetical protein A3K86_20660 [Photobacterium jeanii]|uniref:Glycosyltransferase 2-like domain-containing protein n=1 Tax=Photobacterium jeanii TaxID=858640 RepID=A0A178K3T2_9GAMM|nr:glycosyltransferase family A protein [Photobacterium jeanii]OAN11363.1 hypothetical protein A3K86_20660 [Photobacterium jeanii]PST90883.1 glycosyltransferase family 2 protein [Photobacterium jeanii]
MNQQATKTGVEVKVQVCVFAYNLENEIEGSILSIIESLGNYEAEVFIMANGCRDKTVEKARKVAQQHANVQVIEIPVGDKSNAWNVFTYQYYTKNAIPIYVDGDLELSDDAISNIIDYHFKYSQYNSISSFPWEHGRNALSWRKDLLEQHQFTGSLYLLAPSFIGKIIDINVRLPFGLIGDDSMLGYLAATDLKQNSDLPKERIGVCQDAIFKYESLKLLSFSDIKLYLRRRVRYSIRYMQQSSIVPQLKQHGLSYMPDNASYFEKDALPPIRWASSNFIFDLIANYTLTNKKNVINKRVEDSH